MVVLDQETSHLSRVLQPNSTNLPKAAIAVAIVPADMKTVKIQCGVISRLLKEHAYYKQDLDKLLKQIEDMKAAERCPHDIKQISEVFAETKKMVPQVESQIRKSRDKLLELLLSHQDDVATDSLVADGRIIIGKANEVLGDSPVTLGPEPIAHPNREDESSSDCSEY